MAVVCWGLVLLEKNQPLEFWGFENFPGKFPEVKEGVQQLVTLQNPHVEPQAGLKDESQGFRNAKKKGWGWDFRDPKKKWVVVSNIFYFQPYLGN